METALVIYVLYAAVVLIWSSLNEPCAGLRHLVISAALLREGVFLGATPIVIELRPTRPSSRNVARMPGSLVVSRAELCSLVRWTPPGATLVFCEHGEGCRLDWKIEQVLLELGISAVYWLDLHADYVSAPTGTELRAPSARL